MTPALLEQDLKRLVDDAWDWKVQQINDTNFLVVFPNDASLKLCKNIGGMTLHVRKVVGIFAEPKAEPDSAAVLSKIWILLSGVPACLRKPELLPKGTKMLGRPRMVDEDYLDVDGPVRMLFHSHCPDKLPPHIIMFANMKGYKIRLSFAASSGPGQRHSPPPPDNHDTNQDEEKDTDVH
jgi:hypothetical protein